LPSFKAVLFDSMLACISA